MRVAGLVLALAALLAVGIGASIPTPVLADTTCPPIPTTLAELITAAEEIGPLTTDFRPIYGSYPERAAACLGDAELAFDAFVAGPEGLGGVRSFHIEPVWLTGFAHFVAVDGAHDAQGIYRGPFFPVAVPPPLEPRFALAALRSVTIRGHFNDRAANGCIVIGGDPQLGPIPTTQQAIAICRTIFVVTAIETSGPSPSDLPTPTPTPTPSTVGEEPASNSAPPVFPILAAFVAAAVAAFLILRGRRRVGPEP